MKYDVETLKNIVLDLIGNIGMHGDSRLDSISSDNNDVMGELLIELINEFSSNVSPCYEDYRSSMKLLSRKKYKYLKFIYGEIGLLITEIGEHSEKGEMSNE